MKPKVCFSLILSLGQDILCPLIQNKLNESIKDIKIFPFDMQRFSKVSPKEKVIYKVSVTDRYFSRYKLYSLIFTIERRFIPEHYDFKALFMIEINTSTKEISKIFELYRFQKEKISKEELDNIKNVLKDLFDSFIEGEL